jgi:hypothetical protein
MKITIQIVMEESKLNQSRVKTLVNIYADITSMTTQKNKSMAAMKMVNISDYKINAQVHKKVQAARPTQKTGIQVICQKTGIQVTCHSSQQRWFAYNKLILQELMQSLMNQAK